MDEEKTKNQKKRGYSYLIDPFKVIIHNKADFALWFIFTIIAGQLGIIFNIIIRSLSGANTVTGSIHLDFMAGNFYTVSIATCAAMLGQIFTTFIKNKAITFSSLKIFFVVALIFFLVFSGVIYSAVQIKLSTNPSSEIKWDILQTIVYVLAVLISIYGYCLLKLDMSKFAHLNDEEPYNMQDDKQVEMLQKKAADTQDDGNGVKI